MDKNYINNDTIKHNEKAWDKKVEDRWVWTTPVTSQDIAMAKEGKIEIKLTSEKTIPRNWLPSNLNSKKVLCLASGGGQQGPILAAAGADVIVFDISNKQLEQDRMVAKRERLNLNIVNGNMCDLSIFSDEEFDIVFCPVSATYIPDVLPLFKEVYRVLKNKGAFLFGIPNPLIYLFDNKKWEQDIFEVSNKLPFNSLDELTEDEKEIFLKEKNLIEYSHTLEELIGQQTDVGFAIVGFYEDKGSEMLGQYTSTYFATRSIKINHY